MQASMLGYPFVQDLDAGAEVVSGVLVASKGGRRIILPLVAMRNVDELLGATLRRPGMVAACAAWDADAVPALCILALVTHEAVQNLYTEEASPQPSHVRSLLRPATTECLRSGQQVLHSLSQWKVCWHELHTPAAVHRDKAWLLVRKLHYMLCASLHGYCSLCTQQGTQPRACCRFVANGGTAPALSIDLSASYALKLAENCCSAGKPEDEALLCQLLHSCSTALHADVSAAESTPRPTAATAAGAADASRTGAATAGSTAVCSGRHIAAACRQPALAALQQVPDVFGETGQANGVQSNAQQSAQQPAAHKASQRPQPRADHMQPAWQSKWAPITACAMQVRQE